ncbi:MAG: NAD(P)H-dependent oxidoreductase [Desulfovibrionales bacterium]
MELSAYQRYLCETSKWDFSGLKALFMNCTLKKTPEISHTDGLVDISALIMIEVGVSVERLRPVDHEVASGVYPDMNSKGWDKDEWPGIHKKVMDADILIVTTPIWLGEKSSVCTQVIERLYSSSGDLNDSGQYAYYNRVAGALLPGMRMGPSIVP